MMMNDKIRKASVRAYVVALSAAAAVLVPGVAFADVTVPADPLDGAMGDTQASIQTWVVTYAVPVLVGLTVLGLLIRLGLKMLRRAGGRV